MIVSKHDPSASVHDCVGNNLPHRKICTGLVACMTGDVDAAGFFIHVSNEQAFNRRIGVPKAAREE